MVDRGTVQGKAVYILTGPFRAPVIRISVYFQQKHPVSFTYFETCENIDLAAPSIFNLEIPIGPDLMCLDS